MFRLETENYSLILSRVTGSIRVNLINVQGSKKLHSGNANRVVNVLHVFTTRDASLPIMKRVGLYCFRCRVIQPTNVGHVMLKQTFLLQFVLRVISKYLITSYTYTVESISCDQILWITGFTGYISWCTYNVEYS